MSGYSQALEVQLTLLNRARREGSGDLKWAAVAERLGMTKHGARQAGARRFALMLRALETAEPYYWSTEIVRDTERAALTLPSCTLVPGLLPSPAGFWLFAQPLEAMLPYSDHAIALGGLLWLTEDLEDGEPGIHLAPILQWAEAGRREVGPPLEWPFGRSAEEVAARANGHFFTHCDQYGLETLDISDGHHTLTTFFSAGLLFLRQRIVVAESALAERAARRRLVRDGWQQEPVIRIVELRRKQSQAHQRGPSVPVDWSHRWFVTGHWRQQAVGPGRTERRPVFVTPYVKGPDEKPLKPPRTTIFAVIR